MTKIQLFKPYFRIPEILEEIEECLEKGWTGLGYKTVEFEKKWKEYTGLKNAHFLSSNTVGLHLALRILKENNGWSDGDEIITTPLTFVSTNHSILYENLSPVFADVDNSLCLDPDSILSRITDKTRAVMFVGIGGNTGKLDQVRDLCKAHNLKLILDAAHMSGTKVIDDGNVRHVGEEADVCVFSFQAVKNLPTADSGMICFKNESDDLLCRQLSWLGIDKDTYSRSSSKGSYNWKYDVPNLGFKYHGNSIMAAIGLVQLKYLDEDNQKRNDICEHYNSLLKNVKGINIIKNSKYCYRSSRHLFQLEIINNATGPSRDQVMEMFYNNDIYPGVHYIDNTCYPIYRNSFESCELASKYSDTIVSLPNHLFLSDKDIERVSGKLIEFMNNYI